MAISAAISTALLTYQQIYTAFTHLCCGCQKILPKFYELIVIVSTKVVQTVGGLQGPWQEN